MVIVQFQIKVMLNPEVAFARNTSNGTVLSNENANMLATVSFIRENCFALKFYAFEKSASRFAVVNRIPTPPVKTTFKSYIFSLIRT